MTGHLTLADRVTGSPALRRRRAVLRAVVPLAGRIDAVGLDRIPAAGPVVLAVNHRSALDGPVLFALVERPVCFLVKAEAFRGPLAAVLRGAGQIRVVRQHVDRAAVRECLQILDAGGVVGIFPEGSRGDGRVHTVRPGVAYLALRAGAAVVPVACHGTDAVSHRRSLQRPVATVAVAEPIPVGRYPDDRPLNRRTVAAEAERLRLALAHHVADTTPATRAAA